MGSIPATATIRAAGEHVAQELHFDFFEPGATTALALTLDGVEAERTCGQTALLCDGALGKKDSDIVKSSCVHCWIRAGCAGEGRLVDDDGCADRVDTVDTDGAYV
jgi:hypothetical protein